ncbi:hypothetical protein JW711_05210 [Candidatus Woesearchaeota archaeon]|nr:hypothetical protein [Candidatus Woesearchaeota archaeon]
MDTQKGISPEEKIKQLVQEREEKKRALEKKKKELEDLEKEEVKERRAAEEEIAEQMEEMASDERQRLEEEEEARKKRHTREEGLEGMVGEEEERATPLASTPRGYGAAIEEVMRGAPGFYEVTNYNVMNRLESLATQAQNRPLTDEERQFVSVIEYHATQMAQDDHYKDRGGMSYLRKELAKIDVINKQIKEEKDSERKMHDDYQL